MTHGVLLALGAALIYGFLGVCYEFAAKRQYRIWHVGLLMQLAGLVIGLAVTASLGTLFLDRRLFVLGLIGGLSFVSSISCYLTASRERDIAANWTIVNMSVVLPILMSIIWFKDAFTPSKALGVVATLASIVLIGRGSPKTGEARPTPRWFLFIGLAFATNAFVPALLRFVPAGQSVLFTTYLYSSGSVLFLLVNLVMKPSWKIERGLVGAAVGAAATHWSGIVLTMLALTAVSRVSDQAGIIVYPITNGLVIPIAVILGALILKQRFTLHSKLGVVLGMTAMVLLSLP